MAVVYEAFDRVRGTAIALKCLSVERFSPGKQYDRAVALFEREYYALSQLTHPHIIEVYDYGLDSEGPYYSMELLTGTSLRAASPTRWDEACSLVRDIASALALLHSCSLVHRDVTPLNVHCDLHSRAKLIDFGAMMPAGVARHLVGTPAFIAPESLRQQSLDGRADLFALGACLYFAITGQRAFPAHSLDDLNDAWRVPPAPPSQFAADVPEELDELILALLSVERDDRPRTAAEVYERLTTLARLPREEAAGVAQAYLSRPALVGRSEQLELLRERAQASREGAGCSLLVRGVRGVGRSCMLDAAALEATLAGFQVARADNSAGDASSLGAVRQLLSVLVSSNPVLSRALQATALSALTHEGLSDALDASSKERA
jgi:serine/threonine protein kinase